MTATLADPGSAPVLDLPLALGTELDRYVLTPTELVVAEPGRRATRRLLRRRHGLRA